MRSHLLPGLILVLLASIQSVNAENVSCQITDSYFPSGDWYRGSNQGGANVALKNTGDVPHQFWVKYTVMDSRGQWWDADIQTVFLNVSEETNGMICMVWPIPDGAALGSCQGEFTVWGGYDINSGSVYNLLDQVDQAGAFNIIG